MSFRGRINSCRALPPETSAVDEAFGDWLIFEFITRSSDQRLNGSIYSLRTQENVEIDLVIERPGKARLLVEIKSSLRVTSQDALLC